METNVANTPEIFNSIKIDRKMSPASTACLMKLASFERRVFTFSTFVLFVFILFGGFNFHVMLNMCVCVCLFILHIFRSDKCTTNQQQQQKMFEDMTYRHFQFRFGKAITEFRIWLACASVFQIKWTINK